MPRTLVLSSRSWCTWWRLWCLQRLRAWRALLEASNGHQFGFRDWLKSFSCCSVQDESPLRQHVQRCRLRKSSWLTWHGGRCRCPGELVSRLCRCTSCTILHGAFCVCHLWLPSCIMMKTDEIVRPKVDGDRHTCSCTCQKSSTFASNRVKTRTQRTEFKGRLYLRFGAFGVFGWSLCHGLKRLSVLNC